MKKISAFEFPVPWMLTFEHHDNIHASIPRLLPISREWEQFPVNWSVNRELKTFFRQVSVHGSWQPRWVEIKVSAFEFPVPWKALAPTIFISRQNIWAARQYIQLPLRFSLPTGTCRNTAENQNSRSDFWFAAVFSWTDNSADAIWKKYPVLSFYSPARHLRQQFSVSYQNI